ncbi:NAD(P)-dependent oxidoreductase [Vannielia litorea]|uniref:NAD(P)-dependent oxidoreductase n=1 Tax=Vannielia litorea TaxID=1217970 RepID=UPI001BCACCF6|nr:DUF1932 domain-containing protein [Vannielia litorea]MBS8224682.1 NAD(P)-dependent oxidoreductase [Vannielia litorea]
MTPVVAVVAMGEMGAGLASLMVGSGARVRTCLAGRSAGSFERADRAGVEIVDSDAELLREADFFLSVVPPAAAKATAERFAPILSELDIKPIYVDCNAISPATAREVGDIVAASGAGFVDACLLGNAPAPGGPHPRMFLSGGAAQKVSLLADYGLTTQCLDGEAGQASALKCTYAALGKGLIAIAAWSVLGARRHTVDEVLAQEVAQYQPALATILSRMLPEMAPKAYRWVAEMQEIGAFLGEIPGGQPGFEAISGLFDAVAGDGGAETVAEAAELVASIEAFLATGPLIAAAGRR